MFPSHCEHEAMLINIVFHFFLFSLLAMLRRILVIKGRGCRWEPHRCDYIPPIPQSIFWLILGLRGSFVPLWLLHRVPYQSSGQVQTSSASPGTAEAIFEYFISFANLLKHKVSNTRSRKICMRRSIEGH